MDTIRRRIKEIVGEPLRGCGFSEARFARIRNHFHALGYTSDLYLIVNDATALLPALAYNPATDEVDGFEVPDQILPTFDGRAGPSLENFLHRNMDKNLATQVEVYLLVPLAPRIPPYVLGAFAQSGSQTAETVQQRLAVARAGIERHGSLVLGWAADGASAHRKLMRQLSMPNTTVITIANMPTLLSNTATVDLPARLAPFLGSTILLPETPIFDPIHLLNLLRNAPLRKSAAMSVGTFSINLPGLRDAIVASLGITGLESRLGVRYSDWEVTDRMNYAAAQRLFSTKLHDFVQSAPFAQQHRGMHTHVSGSSCLLFAAHRHPPLPSPWKPANALLPRPPARATAAVDVCILRNVCDAGLVRRWQSEGYSSKARSKARSKTATG